MTKRVRPQPGDIIEIPTPKGLGYAQYTHEHRDPPRYGSLLRVLPGLYAARPARFDDLVQRPEQFLCFLPLSAACRDGIVRVVAQEAIPAWAQAFPFFRQGLPDSEGRVRVWFLWDGKQKRETGELTAELESLPVHPGTWTPALLVQRIAEGWQPTGAA